MHQKNYIHTSLVRNKANSFLPYIPTITMQCTLHSSNTNSFVTFQCEHKTSEPLMIVGKNLGHGWPSSSVALYIPTKLGRHSKVVCKHAS